MSQRSLHPTRRLLAISVGATFALAACGGGKTDRESLPVVEESLPVVENVGADSGLASSGDAVSSTDRPEDEAVLKWAQCMRDNGIDIDDPSVDADGNVQLGRPTGKINPQSAEFQAATDACSDLLAGTTFGGAVANGFDSLQEAMVAFTTCLRNEGLDVGDVDLSAGRPAGTDGSNPGAEGLNLDLLASVIPGLDPDDPKTDKAVETCEPALTEAFNAVGFGG